MKIKQDYLLNTSAAAILRNTNKMKIGGFKNRLYRVEDKVMVSDLIILNKSGGGEYFTSDNPIKDSFKLYIKRWK